MKRTEKELIEEIMNGRIMELSKWGIGKLATQISRNMKELEYNLKTRREKRGIAELQMLSVKNIANLSGCSVTVVTTAALGLGQKRMEIEVKKKGGKTSIKQLSIDISKNANPALLNALKANYVRIHSLLLNDCFLPERHRR